MIAQGVEKARGVEPAALSKALKGLSFESPRGQITINPDTNNPVQSYRMTRNVLDGDTIVPEVLEEIGEFKTPTENVPSSS